MSEILKQFKGITVASFTGPETLLADEGERTRALIQITDRDLRTGEAYHDNLIVLTLSEVKAIIPVLTDWVARHNTKVVSAEEAAQAANETRT